MAMDPIEQQQFLARLGLDESAKVEPEREEVKEPKGKEPKLLTKEQRKAGLTPQTVPVADIAFDPALLDGFVLDRTDMKAASEKVFALYKSPTRDKERNPLLHRRITEFIGQVKRSRGQDAPGYIKEKVKTTKDQRVIAQVLAEHEVTPEALEAILLTMKGGGQ